MRSSWKPLYINNSINFKNSLYFFLLNNFLNKRILKTNVIKITRNSYIINYFTKMKLFSIYNGKNNKQILLSFIINSIHNNYKFGEFFLTRKRAIYKPKLKQRKKRASFN